MAVKTWAQIKTLMEQERQEYGAAYREMLSCRYVDLPVDAFPVIVRMGKTLIHPSRKIYRH